MVNTITLRQFNAAGQGIDHSTWNCDPTTYDLHVLMWDVHMIGCEGMQICRSGDTPPVADWVRRLFPADDTHPTGWKEAGGPVDVDPWVDPLELACLLREEIAAMKKLSDELRAMLATAAWQAARDK